MTADPRAEAEKIIRDALERWVDTSAYYAAGFYSTDADNATDAILDALTAAGWSLLPPGGHSYVERGQYIPAENRIAIIGGPRTGTALAGPIPHSHVRHVIVWPDYTRPNDDWARYLGPWQPSDTPGEPAASHLTEGSGNATT